MLRACSGAVFIVSPEADGGPNHNVLIEFGLHGYSGRWAFFLECDLWRRLQIVGRDIATLQGTVCLIVPPDGQGGSGIAEATMVLHLEAKPGDAIRKAYDATFHMCAAITEVTCSDDGSMHFRSQTLARQRVKHVGDPWPEEGLSEDDVGPWTFRWQLDPAPDEPGQMLIRFETDFEAWSSGRGRARKES